MDFIGFGIPKNVWEYRYLQISQEKNKNILEFLDYQGKSINITK